MWIGGLGCANGGNSISGPNKIADFYGHVFEIAVGRLKTAFVLHDNSLAKSVACKNYFTIGRRADGQSRCGYKINNVLATLPLDRLPGCGRPRGGLISMQSIHEPSIARLCHKTILKN